MSPWLPGAVLCLGATTALFGCRSRSPDFGERAGEAPTHPARERTEARSAHDLDPEWAIRAGVDLEPVPPRFRAEALRLLQQTSCYCGCAHTVAACLARRDVCGCVRCSERTADFILGELQAGASPRDVETMLLEGFSEGYNRRPSELPVEGRPIAGLATARFTIAEFADFGCPHCRAAHALLKTLVETRDDVRVVFYHFPLSGGGQRSLRASEAAEEAHRQGRFWAMAERLYGAPGAFEVDELVSMAREADLDIAAFQEALSTGRHRAAVLASRRLGESLGVTSTPTILIDGRPFGLSRTLRNLSMRLDMEADRDRCD